MDEKREPTVYCLKEDNDGHWYVIELNDEDNFLVWVDDMENDRDSEYDFDECSVGGHPSLVRFTSFWVV